MGLIWPLRGLKLKEVKVLIIGSSVQIGGMVTPHWRKGLKLQPIFAGYWVSQIGARGYADGDNSIHLRYSIFHQLRTGEISSVESSVMFRVKGRTVLSFLDILDKGIEQRIMLSFLNRLGKNNFSN